MTLFCARLELSVIQNHTKMPKRKREDGEAEGSPEVADPKQKRLQLKLEQGAVKVGHAFKVAKGFERQKLGRRQKTAASEKNEKNAQRVETEIAALKVCTDLYNTFSEWRRTG